MTHDINTIKEMLLSEANEHPINTSYFFKTGPGEYAEHDLFLGVKVPFLAQIAKKFKHLSLAEIQILLDSSYNEERLLALSILVLQYPKASFEKKKELYAFYINNMHQVNNWNLVDKSAHLVVGAYMWENKENDDVIMQLAASNILWERRIAIISTWFFIKKMNFTKTFSIAQVLLNDPHDLIHKATGWMLREVGKKDQEALKTFLDEYAHVMPRTMLRYALEKFSPDVRLSYMKK